MFHAISSITKFYDGYSKYQSRLKSNIEAAFYEHVIARKDSFSFKNYNELPIPTITTESKIVAIPNTIVRKVWGETDFHSLK